MSKDDVNKWLAQRDELARTLDEAEERWQARQPPSYEDNLREQGERAAKQLGFYPPEELPDNNGLLTEGEADNFVNFIRDAFLRPEEANQEAIDEALPTNWDPSGTRLSDNSVDEIENFVKEAKRQTEEQGGIFSVCSTPKHSEGPWEQGPVRVEKRDVKIPVVTNENMEPGEWALGYPNMVQDELKRAMVEDLEKTLYQEMRPMTFKPLAVDEANVACARLKGLLDKFADPMPVAEKTGKTSAVEEVNRIAEELNITP